VGINETSELRSLGHSNLLVSPIGLGLAALGRPGYINIGHGTDLGSDRRRETMELGAHAVLDAAYASGVRYFDAARSYGLAEEFLASWLKRRAIPDGSVTVGSKWGYTYTAEWRVDARVHEVKAHTLAVFDRQLDETRAILGQHLALYQIHSATLESGVLDDAAVIDALARARASGLRIGLTVSGPRQAETIWRALDVRRDGVRVFDTVQATWNLLERAAEQALRAAHDAGLGVIVKEALANGRLASRGGADSPGAETLESEAERLGATMDAVAIASVLAEPWVDIVLSGATTVAQLESNVRARSLALTSASVDRLRAMVLDSAEYWRQRSLLPWN
jgi:aryl-alcohol dehydrogenase-like predicted oxidoreductase